MPNLKKQALYLILVILIAFAIRVYNLNYNSPFLDEAIYIMLGKALFNGTFNDHTPFNWVGGMPMLYPTISALAYVAGGIVGARLINVILGTVSVYLMYEFAKNLHLWNEKHGDRTTGIFAALFLAVSAIPISLSRIATYDMLSVTLFLGGLVFLLNALVKKHQNSYFWSALCLLFAFLTKYTVFMFFPFIMLLVFLYARRYYKRQLEEVVFFIIMVSLGIGIYIGKFFTELSSFITGQVVNRSSISSLGIVVQFLQFTYLPYLLGILGLLVLIFLRRLKTPILLFLLSFIPIIVHVGANNVDTLQQSTIFSLIFIFPFAAFFCNFVMQRYKVGIVAITIVLFFLFMQYIDSRVRKEGLEHRWPNSTEAMKYLKKQASGNDKILAESSDVAVLALDGKVSSRNIYSPYYFIYNGKTGAQAYKEAVNDRYFDIIELNGRTNLSPAISDIIDKKFRVIYDKDTFRIYKRIN